MAVSVEGVIFDLDGTLIDYEGASHVALARPLERRGKALSWDLHASIVGTKPEYWSTKLLEATGLAGTVRPEDFAAEYFSEMETLYAGLEVWPGTIALLDALRAKGIPLAIATSSPRKSFDRKMEYHPRILGSMDAVVTGDEVERGKPAPDIFVEAARRIGCDPSRCVVFEDSPHGIEGAQAAGCMAAALPDPRMPCNAPRFVSLAPRWLLRGGIGTFDPEALVRVAPGAPSGGGDEGKLAAPPGGDTAAAPGATVLSSAAVAGEMAGRGASPPAPPTDARVRVKVLFFGRAKELCGSPEEAFRVGEGSTTTDLMEQILARFPPLRAIAGSVVMAVNAEYTTEPTALTAGDEVAIIPPISGG